MDKIGLITDSEKVEKLLTSLPLWVENTPLADDEYLFKTDKYTNTTGFLSKLTQKNLPPKPFIYWGTNYHDKLGGISRSIYVFTEEFRSGWRYAGYRAGKSQEWCIVKHPLGFKLEIYLSCFSDLIKNHDIIKGEIMGEFKWESNNLISK